MRKLLGILLLLAIPAVGALLEGCVDKDECGLVLLPRFFDVQGLTLNAVRSGTGLLVVGGETAEAAAIQLEIQPRVTYYGGQPARSNWLPAAYACPPTPLPGYEGTPERLDSLVVRAVYAFDASHPAGSLLNDLLVDQATSRVLPGRGLAEPNTRPGALWLQLRQGPAQSGPQQFTVRYRLTNGETYTARTPVFTLR